WRGRCLLRGPSLSELGMEREMLAAKAVPHRAAHGEGDACCEGRPSASCAWRGRCLLRSPSLSELRMEREMLAAKAVPHRAGHGEGDACCEGRPSASCTGRGDAPKPSTIL